MEYKYSDQAGVLNEAAPPPRKSRARVEDEPATHNISQLAMTSVPELTRARRVPATLAPATGAEPIRRNVSMFYFIVEEGQRARIVEKSGKVREIIGPARIWRGGRRIEPMIHHVAHPGEFLIVRYRDGKQEHLVGPADLWFDPRVHASVEKEDALQLASKEAVVVYSRNASGKVERRIVAGPCAFVPTAGEWLHTFSWHGSRGGTDGYQKVPNALVFQKLWFLPDQMYHDVSDVRTRDDAVLTIRLMIFFELVDVEKMLDTTHDPIGDFVNAATSDVVALVGTHDFESFKRSTSGLNELETYPQLVGRARQCGYQINKVVYRGYGAPESLQRMHDEAIESRTKLMLERATQEQAQDLEDAKLERDLHRSSRQREEERSQLTHDIEQTQRRREAETRVELAQVEFRREQNRKDDEQRLSLETARSEAEARRLEGLRALGVDLTALLTQARADRVIELRGTQSAPHVHLGPNPER